MNSCIEARASRFNGEDRRLLWRRRRGTGSRPSSGFGCHRASANNANRRTSL